jgi:hypothetical protein
MVTHVGRRDLGGFTTDGRKGVLMFGPYLPLPAGRYTVSIDLTLDAELPPDQVVADCDVVFEIHCGVLARQRLLASHFVNGHACAQMHFAVESMTFGVQFRVVAGVEMGLSASTAIRLESHDDPLLSIVG